MCLKNQQVRIMLKYKVTVQFIFKLLLFWSQEKVNCNRPEFLFLRKKGKNERGERRRERES